MPRIKITLMAAVASLSLLGAGFAQAGEEKGHEKHEMKEHKEHKEQKMEERKDHKEHEYKVNTKKKDKEKK